VNALLVRAKALLQGEPLRAIVYGAAVVVWVVVGIANATGITHFGPTISLDDALVDATAAAAALTEISRRFVFSPATVEQLTGATSAVPPAGPIS
jgi:hypothetical protein